jgi:hypothetical protein
LFIDATVGLPLVAGAVLERLKKSHKQQATSHKQRQ